jgi:Double zinc ribbon
VTDVERFFRRLVGTLAATDPDRLRQPVPLDDVAGNILPYRTNRRALQVDTVEDYELVLLHLCAGVDNLVRTEPEEARARFAQEITSRNPDLTVLYAFENVELNLQPGALARALVPEPEPPHAPPLPAEPPAEAGPEAEPEIVLGAAQFDDLKLDEAELPGVEALRKPRETRETEDEVEEEAAEEAAEDVVAGPSCIYCGGSLPMNRTVNFCPHCGQSQTQILCPECRSEVDPGWRHCVNCGAAVGEG